MRARVGALFVYALAMGLLEAVVVLYLRRLLGVGVGSVLAPPSGPLWASIRGIELTRELATVVMILAVAWLGARRWRGRFGAFAFVFGVWDLAYYVFLAVFAGWPSGPLDWDLLFLIPAPWWGPVLAPSLIAVVLVAAGVRLMATPRRGRVGWLPAVTAVTGGVLLVGTFLLTTPPHFVWAAYVPSLLLFAAGLLRW
ncbi:MAG: hypothetical protein P8Y02_01575 [Deinococcales bacterium]